MTLRQYLFLMICATLLCWVAWVFVLVNVDPFLDSSLGFFFFYITLFCALLGTLSLLSFLISSLLGRDIIPMFRRVQKTFISGAILSAVFVTLLFLQGKRILHLWNLFVFLGVILCLVLFTFSVRLHNKK
ncbi:MAG: hypothetical protein A3J66_00655 [Candidatus Magasanikbacteria bacterium RIFCSPHIGHO2_02_FULL_47_14]|uniref:Uncharacterized protein n=1 Tax=Candidatus Magasanikbacteria bacterium RIFCSPHIGHO2_02_FULL_47_14 TaxID=1798680 RepID=A0A1F6LZ77_9BACT|nr:MAG: hypothetical protein A3J66_00655 [Candidatus Magasanikbacteria bacterium RIFCSPHIGHO2_02_FULL_47_14]